MEERIQKIIARAGIASRRRAEEMMTSGLVTVNGRVVTELGSKADESRDHIKVAGKLLRPEPERVYLLLHKPPEVVSTLSDPEGRRTLGDLLHGVPERVFPVGRLEYHASGLVFLTNDGDLANRIQQSHHLPQTYDLKLKSLLTFEEIENLTRATGARITRLRGKDAPWYEVTLTEARGDALRNKLFETKHPVEKMKRVRIGSLELGSLSAGAHRPLGPGEIVELKRELDGKSTPMKPLAHYPGERRSARGKQSHRKPAGGRPAWNKSVDRLAEGGQSGQSKPEWRKPAKGKPWERRPLDGRPRERAPEWRKSVSGKPWEGKSADSKTLWGNKPPGGKSGSRKPAWGKHAGGKASGNRPQGRPRH